LPPRAVIISEFSMKILLAFLVLTSFSAFANLDDTLNNSYSNDENIKKALLLEVSEREFICSGQWNEIDPVMSMFRGNFNWKFSYSTSNTNPAIIADGYLDANLKYVITFNLSQDLKTVNSFKWEAFAIKVVEENVGTLWEPRFEKKETLTDKGSTTCEREKKLLTVI
jgi:WD40 repeat protein